MDNKIKKEDLGATSGGEKIYYSISTGHIDDNDKCVIKVYEWAGNKHYVVQKDGDNSRRALDMIEFDGTEAELFKKLDEQYNF